MLSILRTCLLAPIFLSVFCDALKAYMFYENAECSGDEYIKGSLTYEYDDYRSLNSKGFIVDSYNGPCYYFEDGYFDFTNDINNNNDLDAVDEYMKQGYCTQCDGVYGCSSRKYSCENFFSISPNNETYYEDAQDNNAYIITRAKQIQRVIKRQIQKENTVNFGGVFIGAIAMVVILGTLKYSITAIKDLREATIGFCNDNYDNYCSDGEDESLAPKDYKAKIYVPSFMV